MAHVDALSRCHSSSASEHEEVSGGSSDLVTAERDYHTVSAIDDESIVSDSRVDDDRVSNLTDCNSILMVDSEDVDYQIRATQTRDPNLLERKRKLEEVRTNPSALYELVDGLICTTDSVEAIAIVSYTSVSLRKWKPN